MAAIVPQIRFGGKPSLRQTARHNRCCGFVDCIQYIRDDCVHTDISESSTVRKHTAAVVLAEHGFNVHSVCGHGGLVVVRTVGRTPVLARRRVSVCIYWEAHSDGIAMKVRESEYD